MEKKDNCPCAGITLPKFNDSCDSGHYFHQHYEVTFKIILDSETLQRLEAIPKLDGHLLNKMLQEVIEKYTSMHERNSGNISPVFAKLNNVGTKINGIKVYTVSQLANAFNVKPKTIRTWIDDFKLQAENLGNYYLVTEDSLIDFLNIYY